MNPTLLEDYIEILEAEKFLDGRHNKYLKTAKQELAKAKEGVYEDMARERKDNDLYKHPVKGLDLDRVDHDYALISNK